jgi:hypothetical protein
LGLSRLDCACASILLALRGWPIVGEAILVVLVLGVRLQIVFVGVAPSVGTGFGLRSGEEIRGIKLDFLEIWE